MTELFTYFCSKYYYIQNRCVKSRVLRTRLSFLKQKYDEDEQEFLTFDAIRQASQCLGRVVRFKKDYAILVLADMRYVASLLLYCKRICIPFPSNRSNLEQVLSP